jgi:hypothetical protein
MSACAKRYFDLFSSLNDVVVVVVNAVDVVVGSRCCSLRGGWGFGGHLHSAVEQVGTADGQRVSLGIEDPLVQGDQFVVTEQKV